MTSLSVSNIVAPGAVSSLPETFPNTMQLSVFKLIPDNKTVSYIEHNQIKPISPSCGTGFMVDYDRGLILTNYHVVRNSRVVRAKLPGATNDLIYFMYPIGIYSEQDIVLLKLYPRSYQTWETNFRKPRGDGSSPLRVSMAISTNSAPSQKVVAVGYPLAGQLQMTIGALSGVRKVETDDRIMLQHSAAINPGNSGGPLVSFDAQGKPYFLGVNTMFKQGLEQMYMAIPIDNARPFIEYVVKNYVDSRTPPEAQSGTEAPAPPTADPDHFWFAPPIIVRRPYFGIHFGYPFNNSAAEIAPASNKEGIMLKSIDPDVAMDHPELARIFSANESTVHVVNVTPGTPGSATLDVSAGGQVSLDRFAVMTMGALAYRLVDKTPLTLGLKIYNNKSASDPQSNTVKLEPINLPAYRFPDVFPEYQDIYYETFLGMTVTEISPGLAEELQNPFLNEYIKFHEFSRSSQCSRVVFVRKNPGTFLGQMRDVEVGSVLVSITANKEGSSNGRYTFPITTLGSLYAALKEFSYHPYPTPSNPRERRVVKNALELFINEFFMIYDNLKNDVQNQRQHLASTMAGAHITPMTLPSQIPPDIANDIKGVENAERRIDIHNILRLLAKDHPESYEILNQPLELEIFPFMSNVYVPMIRLIEDYLQHIMPHPELHPPSRLVAALRIPKSSPKDLVTRDLSTQNQYIFEYDPPVRDGSLPGDLIPTEVI